MELIREGIQRGKYHPPLIGCVPDKLINREHTIKVLTTYLDSVQKNEKSDGKFSLLGASGMMGIGKTAFLTFAANHVVPQRDKTKAAYITFNGGGTLAKVFQESVLSGNQFVNAFGHAFLEACDVSGKEFENMKFDQSLDLFRAILSANSDEDLVLFVDEIGALKEAQDTISGLMSEMDKRNGKLTFVFAHIQQDFLDQQMTGSGRKVIPLPLPTLPIDAWVEIHPSLRAPAASCSGFHQLLLSCCGHPRSICDGIQDACQKNPTLQTHPTESALVTARDTIMSCCKFREFLNRDRGRFITDLISGWFNFLQPVSLSDLARDGLLLKVAHDSEDGTALGQADFLLPLLIQTWATREARSSSVAFHLQQAYAADAMLGHGIEKKMEALMYHYEAVLRKVVEGKTFLLNNFYKGAHVGEEFLEMEVRAPVPSGTDLVWTVIDFSNPDCVLGHLRAGRIVVSKSPTEPGVEYLSPYIVVGTEELLVAACQCKFVSVKTEPWQVMNGKIVQAMTWLTERGIRHFPVAYTTVDQRGLNASTYKRGAFFTESDLFEFTKKLGILRLHTEKLGTYLSSACPWLLLSPSTASDESQGSSSVDHS